MTGFAGLTGVRVLVVGDNPANRELATRLLEPLGVEASTAEDGAAALSAAVELAPAA